MAETPQKAADTTDQTWLLDDLVLRNPDNMAPELKLALGGAMVAASYYARGFWADLAKMVGGVLVAGAVRDLFWPRFRELPAAMRKEVNDQLMGG